MEKRAAVISWLVPSTTTRAEDGALKPAGRLSYALRVANILARTGHEGFNSGLTRLGRGFEYLEVSLGGGIHGVYVCCRGISAAELRD